MSSNSDSPENGKRAFPVPARRSHGGAAGGPNIRKAGPLGISLGTSPLRRLMSRMLP